MTKNLPNWLKQADNCHFPVLSATRRRLEELLTNEENIKVDDLVTLARLDPGLSITLLRRVGRGKTREITTLSHAILLLSIPATVKLIQQLPKLEDTVSVDICHKIKRLYFYQHFTGSIAMDWAIRRKESETNELFTAGLNHAFAQILLYLLDASTAEELYTYQSKSKKDVLKKEKELLGCSVDELSSAIATNWNLPYLIRESFSETHPNPKINGIRLAHELIQWMYIHKSYNYPEALLARLCRHMRAPENKVCSLINRSVIRMFKHSHAFLPAGNAIRAFMSHPASLFEQKPDTKTTAREILLQCLDSLKKMTPENKAEQAIKLCIDALHTALGLSRTAFMLFNFEDNYLGNAITAENPASKELKKISISPELNRLFSRLLQKQTLLIIDNKNRQKYLPHMPPGLVSSSGHGGIILHSIIVGDTITGCFIITRCDQLQFSEKELKAYKTVCKQLQATLTLIDRKRVTRAA